MTHGPVRPGGDLIEDPPARTVFEAVGTDVGAVVACVQPQGGDDDEHVWGRGVGRVDRHPAAWAGRAPADVVLRERVVSDDFLEWTYAGAVGRGKSGTRPLFPLTELLSLAPRFTSPCRPLGLLTSPQETANNPPYRGSATNHRRRLSGLGFYSCAAGGGIRLQGASVCALDPAADGRGEELHLDFRVLLISHSVSDCEEDQINPDERCDNHHDRSRDGGHSSYLDPMPCLHNVVLLARSTFSSCSPLHRHYRISSGASSLLTDYAARPGWGSALSDDEGRVFREPAPRCFRVCLAAEVFPAYASRLKCFWVGS